MPIELGVEIKNQYRVVEHIGRGGMADVWSARDQRLRRLVAIKTIAHGLSGDIDPVALFEREAQTIASMEHPHILPIYDFGDYDNALFIVMRYVSGGSLEDLLADGPMPADEVLKMGDAVGKALDYAHENNVIHLDLKPGNILLDSGESPYLADFGLATVLDAQGRARNPGSGTLLYMAPEQLVSETIDHRADIFSFCVMLFHMLTGRLPFEGRQPLAMRQIQLGDALPDLYEYELDLPDELSDILRKGTAQDPNARPGTHMEIMKQFRQALEPALVGVGTTVLSEMTGGVVYDTPTESIEGVDAAMIEAIDIYRRARQAWQGGQGRFLLGVTHFILISEYYQNAEYYGLELDEQGKQTMLRGAIEYDHELAYWWKQVDTAGRRWVCLHALRSGNAPARIRAMARLQDLPDEDMNPVIPKLVGQALEIEPDDDAKLAALRVFEKRASLDQHRRYMLQLPEIDMTATQAGGLSQTLERIGIQVSERADWYPAVYSSEIDELIAEQVFDESDAVAEAAARTIGRIRSLKAVNVIAEAQRQNRPGALDALALVRDETPELPPTVSRQARSYAWITNTVRRLSDDSIGLVFRFLLVLVGSSLAMGSQVYVLYRTESLFSAQRWANTISMGLVFGVLVGVTYLLTIEASRRLHGFWPWWMRIGIPGVVGFVASTLTFGSFTWLFYQAPPDWALMRFVGFALTAALVITTALELRVWLSIVMTITLITAAVFLPYQAHFFSEQTNIVLLPLIPLVLGWYAGRRAVELSPVRSQRLLSGRTLSRLIVSAAAALLWVGALWWSYNQQISGIRAGDPAPGWDYVTVLWLGTLLVATAVSYFVARAGRWTFLALALFAYVGLYAIQIDWFYDYSFTVPLIGATSMDPTVIYSDGIALHPETPDPLIDYDFGTPSDFYFVTVPWLVVLSLSAFMPYLLRSWWEWIGRSQRVQVVREGWLGGVLVYVLALTWVLSIIGLFMAKNSVPLALLWSGWAALTFIGALATLRYARWGANVLLMAGLVAVIGGVLTDGYGIWQALSDEFSPALLETYVWSPTNTFAIEVSVNLVWGLWAVVIGLIIIWGVLQRRLWSGIGLTVLIVAWFAVSFGTPLSGSYAVLAVSSVALVAYALLPHYEAMESGRLRASLMVLRGSLSTTTRLELPATVRVQRAASPVIVGERPTEIDPAAEIEIAQTSIGVKDQMALDTMLDMLDAQQGSAETDADLMQTRVGEADRDIASMPTKLDMGGVSSVTDMDTTPPTEAASAVGTPSDEEMTKPQISLDTGRVASKHTQPAEGPPTQQDPSQGETQQTPQITFDTSPLTRAKSGSEKDERPAAQRPKIALDTGKLTARTGPDSPSHENKKGDSPKPKISFDTGKMNVRTGPLSPATNKDVPDSQEERAEPPTKPKISFDTGKMNVRTGPLSPTSSGGSQPPKPAIDTSRISKINPGKTEPGTDDEKGLSATSSSRPKITFGSTKPKISFDTTRMQSQPPKKDDESVPEEPSEDTDDA